MKIRNKWSVVLMIFLTLGSMQFASAQWTFLESSGNVGIKDSRWRIQAALQNVKEGEMNRIILTTLLFTMNEAPSYSHASTEPYIIKSCLGDRIKEFPMTHISSSSIGKEPFERIRETAWAKFNIEISIVFKDKKGRIVTFTEDDFQTFKDVGPNNSYSTKLIGKNLDIASVNFIKFPKMVASGSDESLVIAAREAFVQSTNKKAEADCKPKPKDKDKPKESPKEKNDDRNDNKDLKKHNNKSNVNNGKKIVSGGNRHADDFWSGGKEKEFPSKDKNVDADFWKGGKDKKAGSGIIGKDNNVSGIEVVKDVKLGVLQLIHPNGSIIKQWSDDEYYSLKKIDKKGEYFALDAKKKGSGFLAQNTYSIVDKFGKLQIIGGAQNFASITERAEGGYYLEIYTSNSLYNEKLFSGGTGLFQQSYNSSSDAALDIKEFISRRKEERERDSRAKKGTIMVGYESNYNVVQVKEFTINSKMHVLISKTVYKIFQ